MAIYVPAAPFDNSDYFDFEAASSGLSTDPIYVQPIYAPPAIDNCTQHFDAWTNISDMYKSLDTSEATRNGHKDPLFFTTGSGLLEYPIMDWNSQDNAHIAIDEETHPIQTEAAWWLGSESSACSSSQLSTPSMSPDAHIDYLPREADASPARPTLSFSDAPVSSTLAANQRHTTILPLSTADFVYHDTGSNGIVEDIDAMSAPLLPLAARRSARLTNARPTFNVEFKDNEEYEPGVASAGSSRRRRLSVSSSDSDYMAPVQIRRQCPKTTKTTDTAKSHKTAKKSVQRKATTKYKKTKKALKKSHRAKGKRVGCPFSGCSSSFTRDADLRRHLDTIHNGLTNEELLLEMRPNYRRWCLGCSEILARVDARQRHENTCSFFTEMYA